MFSRTLPKGFDKGRLRAWLAVFFLALAIPTAALIWQAYDQLKWEAFHQYRGLAESLTSRVDAQLIDMIDTADARSFAAYTFLNVTGDTRFNFVQRSPLSAFPVADDLPGVIGYFQVDSDGTFSTPLLPPPGTDAEQLGISNAEYNRRLQLAQQIQAVLADNRLVQSIPDELLLRGFATTILANKASSEDEKERDQIENLVLRARRSASSPPTDAPVSVLEPVSMEFRDISPQEIAIGGMENEAFADKDSADDFGIELQAGSISADNIYSQQIFDLLNQASAYAPINDQGNDVQLATANVAETTLQNERTDSIARLSELKLDAALQKKSQMLELAEEELKPADSNAYAPSRTKRREQIALPEAAFAEDPQRIVNVSGPTDLRISTFESEIDPLEFSQLGSGHFVLFRNVWREGERYIQGLLVDQRAFVVGAIEKAFYDSRLSAMSNLIVGYQDNVIGYYSGPDRQSYAGSSRSLQDDLLYSSRLSAPLDSLELIFSINRLPQGPGAEVLRWVTLVLATVFVGGFVIFYRLGVGQINLARQQQDFVSAVSHELKTPLTSIRMYGEMLKEGWADEAKRQDYYEFIHDESERLTRMITNVLQLANITRNEPNFDLKPTNVGQLMGNMQSKIANQVERAGFALEFNRDESADAAAIDIDEDCFAQIIINLVDNAIKFSKNAEIKTIEISSKITSDRQVQFSVRDHGPGIAKNQMKKIFRLFYRSESELTRETVGTGIGLAIVHQLAAAMNGQVDVINRDTGAEFKVSFPAI